MPFPWQINASLVDFWEQGYDMLKTLHDLQQYPPSIEMTVKLSGQAQLQQSIKLSVNFEGCVAEYAPQFQIIILPTSRCIRASMFCLHYCHNTINTIRIAVWTSSCTCTARYTTTW